MKKLLMLLYCFCAACTQPSDTGFQLWKEQVAIVARQKTNTIILQLQSDCDSMIFKRAQQIADSTRQKATNEVNRKRGKHYN